MSRFQILTASVIVLTLAFLVAAAALTRSKAPPGPSLELVKAQSQVHFMIRAPLCFPAGTNHTPSSVKLNNSPGFDSVMFDYAYGPGPNARIYGPGPAVELAESQNRESPSFLSMVGTHRTLDGTEVVMSGPNVAPAMEWIQGGVDTDLVTTLSWDDTARVFHSIINNASDCALPEGWSSNRA